MKIKLLSHQNLSFRSRMTIYTRDVCNFWNYLKAVWRKGVPKEMEIILDFQETSRFPTKGWHQSVHEIKRAGPELHPGQDDRT